MEGRTWGGGPGPPGAPFTQPAPWHHWGLCSDQGSCLLPCSKALMPTHASRCERHTQTCTHKLAGAPAQNVYSKCTHKQVHACKQAHTRAGIRPCVGMKSDICTHDSCTPLCSPSVLLRIPSSRGWCLPPQTPTAQPPRFLQSHPMLSVLLGAQRGSWSPCSAMGQGPGHSPQEALGWSQTPFLGVTREMTTSLFH